MHTMPSIVGVPDFRLWFGGKLEAKNYPHISFINLLAMDLWCCSTSNPNSLDKSVISSNKEHSNLSGCIQFVYSLVYSSIQRVCKFVYLTYPHLLTCLSMYLNIPISIQLWILAFGNFCIPSLPHLGMMHANE